MKKEYAIYRCNINECGGDIEGDLVFRSQSKAQIINQLQMIGADDDGFCVGIYRVDDDGEFFDGSDFDTPSNFIKTESISAGAIRQLTGMNRKKFCAAYGIPYTTMCDWEAGRVTPAPYVLALLDRVVRADIAEKLNK